jgi:hypothetical protein
MSFLADAQHAPHQSVGVTIASLCCSGLVACVKPDRWWPDIGLFEIHRTAVSLAIVSKMSATASNGTDALN